MRIRNYRSRDYATVKKLLKLCGLFDKSYDKPKKFANKTPKGSIIVAEDKNMIVGFVLFTWDGWDSSIYRLAVHPSYRNKGLGNKLLEATENRLKNFGADVVQLGFRMNNKEMGKFFRKQGYYGRWGPYVWVEKKL